MKPHMFLLMADVADKPAAKYWVRVWCVCNVCPPLMAEREQSIIALKPKDTQR